MRNARILIGDVREVLRRLPEASVHCVVTSPPYWGLRDYGLPPSVWGGRPDCAHEWGDELKIHKGGPHGDGCMLEGGRSVVEAQALVKDRRAGAFCSLCGTWRGCLGLEPTFALYVEHMVEVFADVHRVLRPEGTLWLNLGDCYATGAGAVGDCPGGGAQGERWAGTGGSRGDGKPLLNGRGETMERAKGYRGDRPGSPKHAAGMQMGPMTQPNRMPQPGLKAKDLVGIPWRVAFALQADGWYLRSDCVWAKPNPMPESVTDRPTKAHEYLFLLAKSERYFYDADAIRDPHKPESIERYEYGLHMADDKSFVDGGIRKRILDGLGNSERMGDFINPAGRNRRTVWTIATKPYSGAHFAVMPEDLVEPCILAGTREGETVLDPFAGSGTVGVVALRMGREFIGIDLNPDYVLLARDRIERDASLLNRVRIEGAA